MEKANYEESVNMNDCSRREASLHALDEEIHKQSFTVYILAFVRVQERVNGLVRAKVNNRTHIKRFNLIQPTLCCGPNVLAV